MSSLTEEDYSSSGVANTEKLATRLVGSCLAILPKADSERRQQFGRFRLWADSFYTPEGQLDDILDGYDYLKKTTIMLLANFGGILIVEYGDACNQPPSSQIEGYFGLTLIQQMIKSNFSKRSKMLA
jgi:hypothetical protein